MRRERVSTLQKRVRRLARVVCRNSHEAKKALCHLKKIEAERLRQNEHMLSIQQGLEAILLPNAARRDLKRLQESPNSYDLAQSRFDSAANAFYALTRFRTEQYLSLVKRNLSIVNAKSLSLRRRFEREQLALCTATHAAHDCRARLGAVDRALKEFESSELATQRKWSQEKRI